MSAKWYSAYGLTIRSELPLPEFSPLDGAPMQGEEVQVKFGSVVPLSGEKSASGNGYYYAHPERVIYSIPGVGRFHVSKGAEVVIDPFGDVGEAELRLYVNGIAMATVLHQRGFLVLHASAVSIHGEAVLFLGGKGYGKSTMAASLHERGHPLVSDDVVPLLVADTQKIVAYPGFPQLKLWPDAAEASLGRSADDLEPLYPNATKKKHSPEDFIDAKSVQPRHLFILSEGDDVQILPIRARDAFGEIMRHTFLRRMVMETGNAEVHFKQVVNLVKQIAVARLERPKNFALLDRVAAYVENHVNSNRSL